MQRGHADDSNHQHEYRASLIYDTAKEAAQVDLQTLLDTVTLQAMPVIAQVEPSMSHWIEALLNVESKQLQPQPQPISNRKEMILSTKILPCITTLLLECETTEDILYASCVQVLEFLLRKYHIEERQQQFALFWTLLPIHAQFPNLFYRALLLTDFGSHNSYFWIRPYCATNNTKNNKNNKHDDDDGTQPPTLPSRKLLARNIVRRIDLLQKWVDVTRAYANLEISNPTRRRGVSYALSFSALLIVQGLQDIRTSTAAADIQGESVREGIIRTVLPTLSAAVGTTITTPLDEHDDLRAWGYVVASSLAEQLDLSDEMVEYLTGRILTGVTVISAMSSSSMNHHHHDATVATSTTHPVRIVDEAITCVLSILMPPKRGVSEHGAVLLPLLNGKHLGCNLPKKTFEKLCQLDGIVHVLQRLHRHHQMIVAPLIAAMVKQSIDDKNPYPNILAQLLSSALDFMYQDPRFDWNASVTNYILRLSSSLGNVEMARQNVPILHGHGAQDCERGIAYALADEKNDPQTLAAALDGIVNLTEITESSKSSNNVTCLIPPRMALEHDDSNIRINAISQLTKIDVAIAETLIRHIGRDPEPSVVTAAIHALQKRMAAEHNDKMHNDDRIICRDNAQRFGELLLYASYKQLGAEPLPKDVSQLFLLVAYGARDIAELGETHLMDLWCALLVVLAAHLPAASQSICVAFGLSVRKSKKQKTEDVVNKLLLENEVFMTYLQKPKTSFSVFPEIERKIHRRCVIHVLNAMLRRWSCNMAEQAKTLCLGVLHDEDITESSKSELPDVERETIRGCLEKLLEEDISNETVPDFIIALALTKSNATWESTVEPILTNLISKIVSNNGQSVAPLAVLLEAASRPDIPTLVIRRLLKQAKRLANVAPWLGIVPALALMQHEEERVRTTAIDLLLELNKNLPATGLTSKENAPNKTENCIDCSQMKNIFSRRISSLRASAKLGGESFLVTLLSERDKKTDSSTSSTNLSKVLLCLCVMAVKGCSSESADDVETSWLPPDATYGGCCSAATLLRAMELAGEEAFSLLNRWKYAGQPIMRLILSANFREDSLHPGAVALAGCIISMLKGVVIMDPRLVITLGHRSSTGGRTRAYSVGKLEGVNHVKPYPQEMQDAVVDLLSGPTDKNAWHSELADAVTINLLASPSWGQGVFSELSRMARKNIVSAALKYIRGDSAKVGDEILIGLSLDAAEIKDLLTCANNLDVTNESILVDFVRDNAEKLVKSSASVTDLIIFLFGRLSTLHVEDSDDDQGNADFVRHSILLALVKLFRCLQNTSQSVKIENAILERCVQGLLGLLDNSSSQVQKIWFHRIKKSALSLLVALSHHFPSQASSSLIPAMLSAFNDSKSVAAEVFSMTVPAYLKYAASANLSITPLLCSFINAVTASQENEHFFKYMADSLVKSETPQVDVSALLVVYLAYCSHLCKGNSAGREVIDVALSILRETKPQAQMSTLLLLLKYTRELLNECSDEDDEPTTQLHPSTEDIVRIAVHGANGNEKRCVSKESNRSMMILSTVEGLLRVFNDGLTLHSVRKYIKHGDSNVSSLSLRLWQSILMVQSAVQVHPSENIEVESNFHESMLNLINESREYLQEILPAPIFLASVSSLVQEGGTTEIRSKALRLIADRASKLESTVPEAALFVDIIPVVLDSLAIEKGDVVQLQSALVAMEHLSRALSSSGKQRAHGSQPLGFEQFKTALQRCAHLLEQYNASATANSKTNLEVCSSIAFCSASLIRIVGAPSLPTLPMLMKSLTSLLSFTNSRVKDSMDETETSQLSITQMSAIRAILAVVESVPQFLPPHLPSLLRGSVLLSDSIRNSLEDSTVPVGDAVKRLDNALATRVPFRLLIPAASKAQINSANEFCVLLTLIQMATEHSESSTVNAHKELLLKLITNAFDYVDSNWAKVSAVIHTACDLLDTVVLKLSELQLRRIFALLRDWRMDLDSSQSPVRCQRRFAFWLACARLSKELRSIFLPCLSTVMDDLLSELKLAAASLCPRSSRGEAWHSPKKRQKVEVAPKINYGLESMRVLHVVLHTLEHSLRADGHQGGSWIRADDNKRYEDLLKPLGVLLMAHIPNDGSLGCTYAVFVEGNCSSLGEEATRSEDENSGHIVGCLTALAAAGGNEQLWKPLNHAILQACNDESRSEVRHAGLVCMLELMKALGEEYMVLLPENLPALAELLEDTNEDVSSLAREAVTLAEELIGESLEDSLR